MTAHGGSRAAAPPLGFRQGAEGCSACDGSGRVEVEAVTYLDVDGNAHSHTYTKHRRPEIACPRCTEPDERERESPT